MLENLTTNKFSNLNPVQSDWIIRAFYCLETVLLRQKDFNDLTTLLKLLSRMVTYMLRLANEPSRARTCDHRIKSPLLYHLSYRFQICVFRGADTPSTTWIVHYSLLRWFFIVTPQMTMSTLGQFGDLYLVV